MVREWEQGNCAEITYFTKKRAAREMEEAEKKIVRSLIEGRGAKNCLEIVSSEEEEEEDVRHKSNNSKI